MSEIPLPSSYHMELENFRRTPLGRFAVLASRITGTKYLASPEKILIEGLHTTLPNE